MKPTAVPFRAWSAVSSQTGKTIGSGLCTPIPHTHRSQRMEWLITAYRQGLSSSLQLQMAIYDDAMGLENLFQCSIRVSQRLTACHLEPVLLQSLPSCHHHRLQHRLMSRWKLMHSICHKQNANAVLTVTSVCIVALRVIFSRGAPVHPPHPAVSTIKIYPMTATLPRTTVSVTTHNHSITAQALIDNFISRGFLKHLHLKKNPCQQTLNINSILGKPLGREVITHCTPPLTLCVGCLHKEEISFLVLEDSTADIILGCLWMHTHSPQISWSNGEILLWSDYCFQ